MLFLSLYLLWILFNARVTLEILLIGLPVTGAVYLFSVKALGVSPRKDFRSILRLPRMLCYLLYLWKEVLVSALRVMRRIWTPGQPVSDICEYDPGLRTQGGRVLLADSITLTPGTITLEAEEGHFQVHCLEADFAEDLRSGPMLRKVQNLEGAR